MTGLRSFELMTTLVIAFKKIESDDATKYSSFYSTSKAETIINENDIDDVFGSIYTTIISNIQKYLGKGLGWIIDSVVSHTINISKYNHSAGSSYIKLPKQPDHPKKGLINIQNINNNECFNWCLVRYLHPLYHHPARIRKVDELCGDKLDFKGIKFRVKVRDIHKILPALVFLVIKIRINIQPTCGKNVVKINMLIYY